MKRIMLDSNVHDLIVADMAAKDEIVKGIKGGRLKLISTHIQRDELTCAPDPKRDVLLAIYELAEPVPTKGAIWDVSRWDECEYGSETTNTSLDKMMDGNQRHAEDALIASTAGSADVFVTNDQQLASKIGRSGISVEVWGWPQFVSWLTQRSDEPR
jgi:hypothetical protein